MASSAKKGGVAKGLHKGPPTKRQTSRMENRARIYRTALEIATARKPYDGEYSDDLGEDIATMVVDGATLENVSALPNMPPLPDMLRWIVKPSHPFRALYYSAKAALVPLYEERAQAAATQALIGRIKVRKDAVTRDGDIVTLEEEREIDNVERSRLMVATYQWTLSHLSPKKHGPKADQTPDKPTEQLEALFAALKAGPAE